MPYLSHESLEVYKRSIEFVAWSTKLVATRKITGPILNQFKRAYISVPLNIAEGAGKHSGNDQARFYDIAKGSALECGACLDVLVAMKEAKVNEIEAGKEQLRSIVAMLTGLARSAAGDRLREDSMEYEAGDVLT
ncbi:MAG: four helix bundle protein [Pirellulaceae bacterium]